MTGEIAEALVSVARIGAQAHRDTLRLSNSGPERTHHVTPAREHGDQIVEGVKLDNYCTREMIEAGTHVLIIDHSEYLEPIPVPPTPEELAAAALAKSEEKKLMIKVWGGVAAGTVVILGALSVLEKRSRAISS